MQRRTRVIAITLLSIVLVACNSPSNPPAAQKATPTKPPIRQAQQPTPTPTPAAPLHYNSQILLSGNAVRPDDLTFDTQGNLLFSDPHNNFVGRLDAVHHTFTKIYQGIQGPEGLVVLSDGTLIVAEQHTQRILAYKPGATTPTVLRTLPGTPSTATCKDGVDGIAYDQTTQTLIIPDSPTGDVYRMSMDGKTFTLLASGLARPVGAVVDSQGTIYVADECGGAVWRITRDGQKSSIGGFGMPDDVAFDSQGILLVIDLAPAIHALIRVNLVTGQRTVLGSAGYIEPQGLIVDHKGDIFVSDDFADTIVEYTPIT
jgi:streptogramin lyase